MCKDEWPNFIDFDTWAFTKQCRTPDFDNFDNFDNMFMGEEMCARDGGDKFTEWKEPPTSWEHAILVQVRMRLKPIRYNIRREDTYLLKRALWTVE